MDETIDKEVQIVIPKIDKYKFNIFLFTSIILTSVILVVLR